MEEEKQAKYVLKEKKGFYYFELVTPIGLVLMTSCKYSSNSALHNGIACAMKYCQTKKIEDKRTKK